MMSRIGRAGVVLIVALLAMMSRIGRAGVVLIVALLAGSCRDTTGPEDDLARARARWLANGPADYSYRVFRSCECLPDYAGPVIVTVRNRLVTSRRYVGLGSPPPTLNERHFPPIEGLFDLIESALSGRDKRARVSLQFDPALGYPVSAFIGETRYPDGGFEQYVSEFRPE